MKFLILLFMLCFFPPVSAFSAVLVGQVVDEDRTAIPGVSLVTNVPEIGTTTDNDGRFRLELTAEVNRVTFSSVGFNSIQYDIAQVPPIVVLKRAYYRGEDILVTADRAQRGITPIAFDNYSTDDIQRDFTIGDLPLLLNTTPNYYSFSDGGSDLGYTYTQIRGFDDKRIATYINGVPLNDPEDQYNYWVDLPDFMENVADIQIQRGVGNSLYGDASFGGSINVVTSTLGQPRRTALTAGFGQYMSDGDAVGNTYKQAIEYSSGLINGRWAFSGRFSKTRTEGYRKDSWVDSWAYFISAARLDPNMKTELYVFGGPMRLRLTYFGIDRATIESDRRYNPFTYPGQVDNFNQPHYHLHNTWRINDKTTLYNTLYYVRGEGYYEQQHRDTLYSTFNIDTAWTNIYIDTTGGDSTLRHFTSGDIVQQRSVEKNQIGWNPRLEIKHDRGSHSLGGSFYYFDAYHHGDVIWAENIGLDGFVPQHRYYQHKTWKVVGSFYGQEIYRLTDKLSTQATLQLRYQNFNFDQVRMGAFAGYKFELDWWFLSPRLGFNYKLIDEKGKREANLYTNFAVASRTPTDFAIYDASNPYEFPSVEIESFDVIGGDTVYSFGDPTFASERVYNIELGGNYRTPTYTVSLNFYWMNFTDEIIKYGGINPSNGQVATANADGSYRAGIELSGDVTPIKGLKLSGNVSFNRYRIKDFVGTLDEYYGSTDSVGVAEVNFENTKGLAFPDILANFIGDYKIGGLRLTYRLRFVGKQYMELLNLDSLAIDAYSVSSLSASYDFRNFLGIGDLIFIGTVDNLFDKQYLVSGYGWNYAYADNPGDTPLLLGGAEYYVGPERSYYLQTRLEFF